jgi:hypothetical protein
MTLLDDGRLTSQELAAGARLLAVHLRQNAERQESPALREIFEQSERIYRELAAKYARMIELARPDAVKLALGADREGRCPPACPVPHLSIALTWYAHTGLAR